MSCLRDTVLNTPSVYFQEIKRIHDSPEFQLLYYFLPRILPLRSLKSLDETTHLQAHTQDAIRRRSKRLFSNEDKYSCKQTRLEYVRKKIYARIT